MIENIGANVLLGLVGTIVKYLTSPARPIHAIAMKFASACRMAAIGDNLILKSV